MRRYFTLALVVLLPFIASAHDPGLSGAIAVSDPDKLELTVSFAIRDACQLVQLDANGDGQVTPQEFAAGRDRLAETVATNIEFKFNGSAEKAAISTCQQDDAKNVSVRLHFSGVGAGSLEFDFPLIQLLPFGHRMFFSMSDAAGKTLVEKLLSASSPSVVYVSDGKTASPPVQPAHTFIDFVLMGVEHIGTGYDHLLFLFALMVVTRTFRSALAVITAFTIAHSITLAISTFNLVTISPNITEPMIAATIVYVGLENLWRHGDPHKRWLLTFSFGLIHGFGFATALREMGVGQRAGGVVLPLFGFNLGVEIGQLTVAAIVLPVVWKLRTKPWFLRYGVAGCSIAVALAGAFWFVQRVWFN